MFRYHYFNIMLMFSIFKINQKRCCLF